ncbi:MAG: hypothetical protein ACXWLV_03250 [Rhizomicrobium sp.]
MTLIDRYLPRYQFSERHEITIAATPARILDTILSRDMLGEDRIVRAMMALRSAPSVIWQRFHPTNKPTMTSFGMHRFTPLGRDGDREIASGLAGRFWRPDGGLHTFPEKDAFERAEAFLRFTAPGTAKLVFNLVCEPFGTMTRLVTETRVFCPDARSRILFTPYWLAIRLGSGFIRKRYLRAIKRAAESETT